MTDASVEFSIALLSVAALAGCYFCWRFAREAGTIANIRTLVLLNFVVIQLLSGIAHLSGLGGTRGYFDLLNFPDYIWQANLAALIGLVCLIIGASKSLSVTTFQPATGQAMWRGKRDVRIGLLVILMLGPAAIYGLIQVSSIATDLGSSRIIALTGGTARYAFLSHWVSWIVTIGALIAISLVGSRHALAVLLIVASATTLTVSSLAWTGGRSMPFVMALPLVLYALPRLRGLRAIAALLGGAAALAYIVAVSQSRSEGVGIDIGNWLDWEWGRYSIIGTSFEYVRLNGFLYGQTFVSGVASAALPLLGMVGLNASTPGLLTSTDVSSRILFGTYDAIHVVPGLSAELYVNFGLAGIGAGYLVLGRAAWWVDTALRRTSGAFQRVFLYYLGVLLAFRTIPADSASILFYLFYSGAPLLVVAGLSQVLQPSRTQKSNLMLRPEP